MSDIEWTEKTWNPVAGCKKISPGCKNCYAETMTGRLEAMGDAGYSGLTKLGADGKRRLFTGEFRERPDRLDVPLKRKKPTTWFVNSMSDLFGEGVSDEFIAAVFGVMAATPQHTYQVLTKRAGRMCEWNEWIRDGSRVAFPVTSPGRIHFPSIPCRWFARSHFVGYRGTTDCFTRIDECPTREDPLPNVHIGVSVEDRKHGLPRIDELRKVPAAVRFLSIEPLLEDLGDIDLTGIHWVIVGGESGHNARPMHPDWVRSIRDQCRRAKVPFFFKQWGGVIKSRTGRELDGRTWDEMPTLTRSPL
jgi:protein gp37